MAYDINGEGYDPKEDFGRYPSYGWVIVLIIAAILGVVLYFDKPLKTTTPKQSMTSIDGTLTNEGTYIKWYVFVDPDTGAEYLVNDRGGCTPRLDRDGEPILLMAG